VQGEDMWLTLLKVLLIAWLAISLRIMVIMGVRRSRANRGDPNWTRRTGGQPGYEASIRGNMPVTPLPERVDWDDNPQPGGAQRQE
jgi:hypothetical protein